jgi:site-specific DNA-methyltransferase (adenine-specific)
MTFNNGMVSRNKQDYNTPLKIYDYLDREFHFDCDPCPSDNGSIVLKDGLGSDWGNSNFVNPPYRYISKWISKGFEEWKKGKIVVFLIPVRTDTRWWQDIIMSYAEKILFIRRRIRFSGAKWDAPFPSCIVVFRSNTGLTKFETLDLSKEPCPFHGRVDE